MEDIESTKTSDEIINELFSSLNVPLSPKPCEEECKNKQQREESTEPEVPPASDNSEDEDSDSRSSASEEVKHEEVQVIEAGSQEMEKAERHRSSKKKKDKKKKKKKKKKKEEGGSKHKHKKKRKKDAEKEHNGREEAKGAEEGPEGKQAEEEEEQQKEKEKEKDKDKEKTQPPTPEDKKSEKLPSQSESPKRPEKVPKMAESENKLKRKLAVEAETREESSRKHRKTDHSRSSRSSSPSKSRSHTRTSRRSRSRSAGRGHSRYSRSRSRSRSKPHSYSRSHSRSHRKSRSRSPFASDRRRRKRSSRSYSRSASPKRYKRRRSSRSRSKSPSGRSSSSRRSGSRSKSRAKVPYPREVCDLLDKARERVGRVDASKAQSTASIDVSSIPTPGPTTILRPQGTLSDIIALDSIPLPIPPPAAPDPSSIPLPQPLGHSDEALKKDAHPKGINGIGLDLETIPVPAPTNMSLQKDQDSARADVAKGKQEEGAEKNKAKTIIIKSLKDSLVFLQAQEEAERKAKENAELEEEGKTVGHSAEDEDEEKEEEDKEEEEEEEEEEKQEKEEQERKDGEELREREEEGEKEDEEEEIKEMEIKRSEGKTNDPSSGSDTKSEPACAIDIGKVLKETREKIEKNGKADKDGAKVKTEEKEETLNGMEEGEIASEEEEPQEKSQSKPHKKKSKKDKDKHRDKRKSKKEKDRNKEDKKKKRRERERSRSRTRERAKSRSRSRSHDRGRSQTRSRTHERGRSRSRSRSRERHKSRRHSSRSRDRSSRVRHKSRSRSRSRSKSHSHRKRDSVNDLRDKVTRKRLLEIARRNAVYLMQNGCLPPSVEQEQLVKIKAGGKSVEELTNFCKQLVATGNYSDVDLSEPSLSSGDDNENSDKPFSNTRHPFSVRDSKPILMNIRNAPMLPTKTNAERLADQAKLREQFPVSSGSQHRTKGELTATEGKLLTESSWVPVSPKEKKEGEDKVFPEPEPVQAVDISQIVSTRLSAMRKLQDNPHDIEAIKALHNVQKEMQNWALSKQEPGQFTGSTGVKVLSQEELSAGHQAWARKEQFKEAAPVRPQFGLKMLQKMGWSPGEGLGKNKEGTLEPLLLDVKMDKKDCVNGVDHEQFKEAAPVRPQFGLKMLQKMGWSPGEGLGKNKEGTLEPLLLDVKMDKKDCVNGVDHGYSYMFKGLGN
ncbi:protein SON-like [Penaeus indicus]|uniref:protein SON-like n=1 Tax=Penaeus indicus TaxID=29960 RepID=UPI00300CCB5F